MWVNNATRGLPAEYQEVEYIENNGTAYILTGLDIKDGYRNQMKVRFLVAANADTYPGISGGYLGPDSGLPGGHGRFYLNGLQINGKLNYGYLSNYGDIGSGLATGTDYEIDYSWISGNAFVKLNGNTLQSSSATYSTSLQGQAPIGGWAHMDLNQYWANPGIRIYYSQFYNSAGTLVRDFVPCYRKSDNIIGMYDLVNNVFYTNDGTGAFTKGSDVPDMVEKQVRPSGWKPGANTIAYYKFDGNLNDSSGNSHTLSNTGSISYSTNPYAVNLSTSNYLYFNNTDTFNHDRTYNTWAYITARNQSNEASVLMCQGTGSQNRMIFCSIDYQGKLFFGFYGNDHTGTITSSLNQWVNVCYTYNYATKTYKAYINSVKDIEGINSTQYTIASGNLYMGALANDTRSTNYRVQGKLSEYILEDKARTAQEVADYYNQTKANYGL